MRVVTCVRLAPDLESLEAAFEMVQMLTHGHKTLLINISDSPNDIEGRELFSEPFVPVEKLGEMIQPSIWNVDFIQVCSKDLKTEDTSNFAGNLLMFSGYDQVLVLVDKSKLPDTVWDALKVPSEVVVGLEGAKESAPHFVRA